MMLDKKNIVSINLPFLFIEIEDKFERFKII